MDLRIAVRPAASPCPGGAAARCAVRFGAQHFHVEYQQRIGRDSGSRIRAVGEFGRHEQLPFRARLHQHQRLLPALDHAVARETSPACRASTSCRIPCRRSACRDSPRSLRRWRVIAGAFVSPAARILYCRPEAVVFTPFSLPLRARNSSAAVLLRAPWATIEARAYSCTCCRSAGVDFLPCNPSFKPRSMALGRDIGSDTDGVQLLAEREAEQIAGLLLRERRGCRGRCRRGGRRRRRCGRRRAFGARQGRGGEQQRRSRRYVSAIDRWVVSWRERYPLQVAKASARPSRGRPSDVRGACPQPPS